MKGLIPAAGKGTRMRPFTRAYPKELLPVGKKAVIEHAIDALKMAGIDDICIIVGHKQHAILDYLGSGEDLGVHITYAVQDERTGLATAVKAGERVIDDEPFAVVLGDSFFNPKNFVDDLRAYHENEGADATIGAVEVDDPTSFGVIDGDGDEQGRVNGLVEKPAAGEAPSNLAIAGVYMFQPEIFDAIDRIDKGAGGEYQLTDAITRMMEDGKDVRYKYIPGEWIDVGTPERLKRANREFDL
ncbi:MAG: sugar phosphate nucleotidyltransferase [Candidatus Nanohaloarchaea archaeon]|nr:sugar phosphate nucleotidyltransferase [Candidatus Nanohaloarchaea archaeon]